jgi:two-component system, cell cycle sensor histidine kinase and response regulator CckA
MVGTDVLHNANMAVLGQDVMRPAEIDSLIEERDAALDALSQAHEQLRNSEELLLGLFSTSPDGICMLEDRKVYYVNNRICEMLGCEAELLIGNPFTQFIVEEDLVRTQQMYRRLIRSEAFPQRHETVLLTPAGDRVEVSVTADQISFRGRESLMLRIRDISAHRQARKMAVENERLEAVLTVAHSVGSNFANALSVIRSQAAMLVDGFLPNSRVHDAARQVLDAAEHAAELTKRLLSVVRMSGSDASVHIEPVALSVSLQKARDLLATGLDERGVRFLMSPDPRPWYVLADAGQLLDVLMNIFLNAADAMSGGGTIRVEVSNCNEEMETGCDDSRAGDFVCIRVMDTGEGMSTEQIAKVFEPFYTTKKNKHAFGLGLPVAQQMLKRWGGLIRIASVVGEGTTVCLLLPKAKDFTASNLDMQGVRVEDRTLLVVEDHPERRKMMVAALREDGFRILEADNGEQAIDLYREHASEIALTILDWMVPGADGGVVLQKIQDADPDSRVILISGFSRDYVRSQIKRGAWAFLQKPFATEDLRAMVSRTLPPLHCHLPVSETSV